MQHRVHRRAAIAVAALLFPVTLLAQPVAASAVMHAQAKGTTTVSSATWAAIATQATTPSQTALTLTFGLSLLGGAPTPQYFDVVNTGTRTLSGTAYFVAISGFSLLSSPDVTLKACAVGVAWNQGSGLCPSGATTVIGPFHANSTLFIDSTAAPTSSGTHLHLQASVSNVGLLSGTLTAIISAQVSSFSPRDFVAVTNNS
jgi:hypothetical protein